ncbi:hypothetical protein DAEQUDRAFT_235901 [Daedalea quercina L-15889]|uniref:Uncharacterized protein n=1 Tax=Daedalea quercina L-15889 TaxID=1314783 RepID=A0A165QWA5_9APHY|nr:hypothetical protein DAEQUDRAFT_235901 [Daedalea quercina L-15889]
MMGICLTTSVADLRGAAKLTGTANPPYYVAATDNMKQRSVYNILAPSGSSYPSQHFQCKLSPTRPQLLTTQLHLFMQWPTLNAQLLDVAEEGHRQHTHPRDSRSFRC